MPLVCSQYGKILSAMRRILQYLNPLHHLGDPYYSFLFPLFTIVVFSLLSEFFAYSIVHDSNVVGVYGIFLFVALIIYFAFREGIVGGLTATFVTILYYIEIVITRHASPIQIEQQWEIIVVIACIYIVLSLIIGGLKQYVDTLIEREANGRRRLTAIIEQLPVGIVITDHKGYITNANKQIDHLFGSMSRVGLQVDSITWKKSEHNKKPVAPNEWPLAEVLQTGNPVVEKEFTIESIDGEKKYLQFSASLIRNKSGKTIAAASIITDITRQKEMENIKDDFINMASHELKTPLTTIKVFVQVLKRKLQYKKNAEPVGLIEKIDNQLNQLTSLVGELLDVTRMQKGALMVERQKFYVKELALDIISDLQPTTNHKLILDWHTKLPVYADKEKIRQVLTNLITNAIKYSPKKTKVYIGSRKEGGNIVVYVKDIGMGIPKSQQEKIFERFYQVKGNSTYPGLGLGLYISSQIVEKHKGKMWVESKEGKGSTFYFSLPTAIKKK